MDVLLVLGFVMLVVTFVGHGIWLFVAFLFRSLTEPYQSPPAVAPSTSPKRTCPHCGAFYATTFRNCPTCGKLVDEPPRSPAAKLQSLQRELDRLLAEEVLSLEQFESARRVLQQAVDKHQPSFAEKLPVEKPAELPTLVADEAIDVVHVSNVPLKGGHVENVPHERSTWTDWLQAFLEEKNIRWGELLAGLLIVGSSVGLVISLWSTLRNAIPYFPALCFLAVTAAIHGAGLYTLRHWRLKTTSRGLLTIALLLVPLNFLAAIALSEQRSATDPLYLTAVAIGLVAYGWITWSGTRELMHFGAAWLSLAVLGSAIGQLVIGRRTSVGLSTLELNGLFALPLATYVVALLGTSLFVARWRRRTSRRVESLYRLLGIAFFSLAVALSLLLWKSQAVLDTLSRLSPCVSLAAAMIVGVTGRLLPNVGYVFNVPVKRGHVGNVPHDIAATAVALIGAMLMVAAVMLAWPDPERLIAVGLVNFVALSWFGFATGLAPLHFPALECLALAGLIAFHRFGQAIGGAGVFDERNLISTILLGRSGVVVALMSLLTTAVAVLFWRSSRCREHATSYLAAAAGMAVLSLGIAGYAGFWPHVVQPSVDRSLATVVFVLFGIAGMVANERLNRIEIAWAGAVVWLAVFLHALGWNTHLREWLDGLGWLPDRPIVVALLSFATWSLGCAVVGKVRDRFVTPWSAASGRAVVVALFALPWKVWGTFGTHAIYLGWVAALCFGQAHLWQSRNLFSLSQAVAFIAAALGIASFAERQDWWIAHGNEVAALFDVRHGHWQIAGLAAACLPWILWRHFGGRWAVLARCSDWKFDRLVLPVAVILLAVQTWFGLWPALGFELSSRWNSILSWRWDRVIAFLFGWGAVCWSVEEVTRGWLRRWWPELPTQVRIPWVAEVLSISLALVLFAVPDAFWGSSHQSSLWTIWPHTRELFFGITAWWAIVAVAGTLVASLFDRRRWLGVAGLTVTGWTLLLHANVWWNRIGLSPGLGGFGIDIKLLWSLTGFTGLVMAGSWLVEKQPWRTRPASALGAGLLTPTLAVTEGLPVASGPTSTNHKTLETFGSAKRRGQENRAERRLSGRQSLAASSTGIAIWLCLLPATVLMRLECEAWSHGAQPLGRIIRDHLDPISTAFVCILPMVAWTILLTWQAARQRSSTVLFGASHAWVLGFALIGLMQFYEYLVGGHVAALAWLLLWSVLGLGTFSLLWFWWRKSFEEMVPSCFDRDVDLSKVTPWLWQQLWSWGSLLLVSAIAAFQIFQMPFLDRPRLVVFTPFGGAISQLGVLVFLIAAWITRVPQRNCIQALGLVSMAWVPLLVASQVSGVQSVWLIRLWEPYQLWEFGWLVLAVGWSITRCLLGTSGIGMSNASGSLSPTLSQSETEDLVAASWWSDAASVGVVLLAVREFWFHQSVACPANCVAVVAANAALLAWVNRSQWRAAASTAAVVLATAMAWTHDWDGLRPRTVQQLFWWLEACVVSLACAAVAWQAIEVWWQVRRGERFDSSPGVATAHVAARVAFAAALAVVILVDVSQTWGSRLSISDLGGWLMVPTVALPFVMSWWDRFAKRTVEGICGSIWLLMWMILGSRGLELGDRWLTLVTGLIAADVAMTATIWWGVRKWFSRRFAGERAADNGESTEFPTLTPALSQREREPDSAVSFHRAYLIASWRDRLTASEHWLSNSQLLWAGVASVLVIVGVLNFDDRSLRLWNVVSAAVLIPAIALLAESFGRACSRRALVQRVALALGAIFAVEILWAWMEPQPRADFWLQRSIRALEALAVTAFVYGVGLGRVIPSSSDWRRAVQRAARDVGVLAIVALMAVLCLEAWWFDPVNGSPVTGLQIALVAATLVALAAALLAMALSEHQLESESVSGTALAAGPFAASPVASAIPLSFTRQAFVYAAEVVVALLFLHCYLTMPELFRGYLQPYWPLIVMAIAFAGVGASELCQRAKLGVLSEPFQNSAALLPLIPALGFWVATSRADYSSVLFAGGLVYVWLNLRRSSFWYVLAAALAGNAGLWSLWSEHGVELLVRPQVWLIPPTVSVLAAAQWNRRRLTETQLAAIRYPAITLLYVSSAGEMFLTGIAESFWLPIVLMLLSVLGVLAGIWLRVRAFLYLGTSFLLLSLVSMVWHAAKAINHTWPWWAFGIGLGLGVLTLFGLFERKRNEMLRLLGELRSWER